MLIHTAEIRWFVQGELPREVGDWFDDGGPSLPFSPRTDRYMVLPGTVAVGIKIREGRFEVKALAGEDSPFGLSRGSGGAIERWVKWIAPFPPEAHWIQSAGAVEVTKVRTLRGYQSAEDGVRLVEAERLRGWTDCRTDLASIEVAGQAWWSLAFEAAGDPSGLVTTLRQVLEHVFRERPPPVVLGRPACLSYPAFLQRFAV